MITSSPSDVASWSEVSRLRDEVTGLRREIRELESEVRRIQSERRWERLRRQLRTDTLVILVPGMVLCGAIFLAILQAERRL